MTEKTVYQVWRETRKPEANLSQYALSNYGMERWFHEAVTRGLLEMDMFNIPAFLEQVTRKKLNRFAVRVRGHEYTIDGFSGNELMFTDDPQHDLKKREA